MTEWLLAGNLVLLQVPDVLTTNWILAAGGRELNPVIRLVMRIGPLWWVPKLLVAAAGAAYLAVAGGDAQAVLAGLNLVYVAVVLSNLRQMSRMRARMAGRLPLVPGEPCDDGF